MTTLLLALETGFWRVAGPILGTDQPRDVLSPPFGRLAACEPTHPIDDTSQSDDRNRQKNVCFKKVEDVGEAHPLRFGVSWQIVPSTLQAMTEDPDRERAQRVMSALYGMKKVDAAVLQRAYSGDPVSVGVPSSRPHG
jgi:hypothetical protein